MTHLGKLRAAWVGASAVVSALGTLGTASWGCMWAMMFGAILIGSD